MEKHFDLIVKHTKQSIIDTLNESKLPLSVIGLVVKDINNDIQKQCEIHVDNLELEYQRNLQEMEQAQQVE